MCDLPFVLSKYHKCRKRYSWKRYGIIFQDEEHFDYIYNIYIRETNCDLCNKLFITSRDRQLDHCHLMGDPRNIVCCHCNLIRKDNKKKPTNTGKDHIHKRKDKNYKTGYCFQIQFVRDGKKIINTKRKTLEDAILCRDKFMDANPGTYT